MADQPEKKIHIDEDWKSQVEAEREALKQKQAQGEAGQQAASGPAAGMGADAEGEFPPASFSVLCSVLATQAVVALGQQNPVTGETEVDLPQAKHYIDTLAVLEEKTKGNLEAEEAKMLETMLHELRMGYVAVSQAVAAGQINPGGNKPDK